MINKSNEIGQISKALSAYLSEIKNPKATADNPFFKSKYVTLDEMLDAIRPVLAKYGLSVVQGVLGIDGNISITTLLTHESGEWLESEELTMIPVKKDPQGQGSAITYGRRYSLAAMLGIAADSDDDGNDCSKTPANVSKTNKSVSTSKDIKTTKEGREDGKEFDSNVCKQCAAPEEKQILEYKGLGLCKACLTEKAKKQKEDKTNV